MAFEKEIETYNQHLQEWLAQDEGKFVVIQGDRIIGIFAAYEDALKAGYEDAGAGKFFVKRIAAMEQACFFTRDLIPVCHT